MNAPEAIPGPRSQTRAIRALFVTGAIIFASMYLTQPILPVLSKEYVIAPSTAGLSLSVTVLMIALGSFAVGPLSDLIGRKQVMVWSSFILVIPTALCGFSTTFNMLLLCRGLQGVFIPGMIAVAVAYLGDIVDSRELGAVVGGWIAANVIGGFLGRLVSGLITDFFGWRIVFWTYALLILFGALLIAYFLPTDLQRPRGDWRAAYLGMFKHLRDRRLLGGFLIGATLLFGFSGMFTYLPYYLTAPPFSLPTALVAFAFVSYLAGTFTSPLAGRLSIRIPRRQLIAAGLLIAIVGIALTLIPSLPMIAISLLVVCSGMFTAQAILPAYINTVAKTGKGSAGALYQVFYYLGGAFGNVVPGLAWQRVGWWGVTAVCITAFVAALLANWLLCRDV